MAESKYKVFETPNGKQLTCKPDGVFSLYKAYFKDGGELPKELKGSFTGPQQFETAARTYVARLVKEQEETTANAKQKEEAKQEKQVASKASDKQESAKASTEKRAA